MVTITKIHAIANAPCTSLEKLSAPDIAKAVIVSPASTSAIGVLDAETVAIGYRAAGKIRTTKHAKNGVLISK